MRKKKARKGLPECLQLFFLYFLFRYGRSHTSTVPPPPREETNWCQRASLWRNFFFPSFFFLAARLVTPQLPSKLLFCCCLPPPLFSPEVHFSLSFSPSSSACLIAENPPLSLSLSLHPREERARNMPPPFGVKQGCQILEGDLGRSLSPAK